MKRNKIFNLASCEELISRYINDYGGDVLQVREGVLGLGELVLYGAPGKKTVVIREVYLNEWSSGHTLRKYNETPKKYKKLIEEMT